MDSILYIFSGLPGSGKSVLAKALSERKKASYFRIDKDGNVQAKLNIGEKIKILDVCIMIFC